MQICKNNVYVTNIDLVNDNEYTKFSLILSIRSQDIELKPNSDINQGPLPCSKFAKKQLFTIPTRILSMMMCLQNLVSSCQFVLKILSINRILSSIKGSNSVANLRKTKIYNINIDLVNDNVYTKFGLILLFLPQDIEQKPNSDINQGP